MVRLVMVRSVWQVVVVLDSVGKWVRGGGVQKKGVWQVVGWQVALGSVGLNGRRGKAK